MELPAALDEIAFLYTASEKGNCSGIRFALSTEEACAWCSSDVSRGVLHGTQWLYFWTKASAYVRQFGTTIDLRKAFDNGQWDDRLAALGLTKIGLDDLPKLLDPHGVKVLR